MLRAMAETSTGREESESTRQELLRAMTDAKNQDYGTQNNTQAGAELDLSSKRCSLCRRRGVQTQAGD